MKLNEISFPVYLLGYDKPTTEEGVTFYLKSNGKYLLVDDKTLNGGRLAIRRLAASAAGADMYNIKTAIFFLGDFIKIAKPSLWFIDSNGTVFNYTKKHSVSLIFREITNVLSTNSGYIIEVSGVESRFKTLYAPKGKKFAGLLKSGHSYILYGLYEEPYKDTRRMI